MRPLRFFSFSQILSFMILFCMGFVFSACGPSSNNRPVTTRPEVVAPPPQPNKGTSLDGFPTTETRSGAIAVLAPLTGRDAPLGIALLNAAQLALFELGDDNLILQAFDTHSTPVGAQTAARKAIAQNVDVIIGPLTSNETKAIAPLARQAGIPVIAFTTDSSAVGGGIYMLSFPPTQQATRMASYAAETGRQRMAAILPSTPYGQLISTALKDNMPRNGATLTQIIFYDAGSADWDGVVNNLMRNATETDPGFDVVLLADRGQKLQALAKALEARDIGGINKTRIVGTMLWQGEKIGQNPALLNALYPAPAAALHQDFNQRYSRAFGGQAPRLASLGYDAAAIIAVLAKNGQKDFSTYALTNPTGFMGVDGLFRLKEDGSIERGYAIFEADASGYDREIAPAPSSFETLY